MATTASPPAAAEALLTDGSTVTIRPLRPGDHLAVLDLHAKRMSPGNQRLRFFAMSRRAPEASADRLCAPVREGFLALGAFSAIGLPEEQLLGVVEYDVDAQRPMVAEIAVAVADDRHHQGVGTLLIEHLVHAARNAGLLIFEADALAENQVMLKVFAALGLRVERHHTGPEVRVVVWLDESAEEYLTTVDERARSADVASLLPLLMPRSIAVVGVSARPGSVGHTVLVKIRQGHFEGPVWAVNPHAETVAGLACYPSVGQLPGVPDLAVVAVPADRVPDVAVDCGRLGVRALVVLTSGLDRHQSERLLDACRRHSMRLVGPNCLGIAQTDPAVRLDAQFGAVVAAAGSAGVAVQSGGVGIALMERLNALGIGVSSFVSLGDKYDVSGNDLLQWWENDQRTRLAILHLESFGSPRAFARTARRVARTMPVLTVDAGRSAAGRRGAASHTAAAATPTVTRQALFAQAGITATSGIGELLEAAALLHSQPLPGISGKVAVISNAGGIGVLAADACAEAGLVLPELPAPLMQRLIAELPQGSSAANPVDTTAAVDAQALAAAVDLLVESGTVDAVLLCLAPTALGTDPVQELLAAPARRTRPIAVVRLDQRTPVDYLTTHDGGRLPCYADPQSAARALAHAADRARWLAEVPAAVPRPEGIDRDAAEAMVAGFLSRHPEGGWLDPEVTAQLLHSYRIPLATSVWATGEHDAVEAAGRLALTGHEHRVVLKAYWPGQVHKSDLGAVRTGLHGRDAVRDAYRGFVRDFGERLTGVVVQPQATPGTELFAGMVQDQVFGPLVLFGMGGTAVDLLDDRAARLAPLSTVDIRTLLTSPHGSPLLFGYRGAPPADLDALEDLLARLSVLATDLPQLTDIDLNPVIASKDGITCVDARLRLEPRPAPDPYLRRLRRLPDPTQE
ncbi:acyl-CoA synthetase (NDP forming)/GNAT superfamily N-acetyltransferase [Streptacidiphilus sp. MAP12-16]|uniref:bifunctional acetate--CoA ligase family protein/GNAT family N-acetyltransferase n=1 Tax=Streptacidiphilus sp. MAP12-16 TaxID=3156300 RepID=UPI0035140BF0